jgi:DNA-binding transcriptional LysR family regulator
MGTQLVHRTTRRFALSAAGEALLERAAPLVQSLGEVVSSAHEPQDVVAGRIRITTTVDFATTVLARLVTQFVTQYPRVSVDVHASNGIVDLVRGRFDLAVRFSAKARLRDSSLVARRIGTLTTQLVASPRYLARRPAPRNARELADHEWVTYVGVESLLVEIPEAAGAMAARGRVRCDDMFFAREAARAGAGIAALPSFLAKEDLASGALVPILPRRSASPAAVWLVQPPARNVPARVKVFAELLLASLSS